VGAATALASAGPRRWRARDCGAGEHSVWEGSRGAAPRGVGAWRRRPSSLAAREQGRDAAGSRDTARAGGAGGVRARRHKRCLHAGRSWGPAGASSSGRAWVARPSPAPSDPCCCPSRRRPAARRSGAAGWPRPFFVPCATSLPCSGGGVWIRWLVPRRDGGERAAQRHSSSASGPSLCGGSSSRPSRREAVRQRGPGAMVAA
jgi:hypothetical protein